MTGVGYDPAGGLLTETKSREALGLRELIAMGVGGMIGGGIFSVLGLAVGISGHAAPLAFGIGSLIALAGGYSYVRLALAYRNDGASFTYLEKAFPARPDIAGIAGWTVVVGYVGTLGLYAFTFGAYGAELLGSADSHVTRLVLSSAILLFFMVVNLWGAQASGNAEDLVVYTKIILLSVFAVAGFTGVHRDHLVPIFDRGVPSVFMAGALIFVAYEGFQLITNAVVETRSPEKNIPRGIYGSIVITSLIYITLAVVGVGNLTLAELSAAEEYALAAAAKPVLGHAGVVLVGLAALLATSSAINATLFGAARLLAEMAKRHRVFKAFSFRSRTHVPWVALVVLTGLAMTLTLTSGLETIASFSSMTFLVVSIGVSIANLQLRTVTKSKPHWILAGLLLMATTVVLLVVYLAREKQSSLVVIGAIYGGVVLAEVVFTRWQRL